MKHTTGIFILAVLFLTTPFIYSSCNMGNNNDDFLKDIGITTGLDNDQKMAEHGYSYIEAGVQWFLLPHLPHDSFAANLERAQNAAIPVYACNSFIPGRLKSVGPDAAHDDIIAYCDTAFRRAEMIGVKKIVFGSGGSRGIPDGFNRKEAEQQFVDLLKRMGPVAQKYDVTVVIEPLNKGEVNFINTSLEGLEIVKAVDHPNIRLLVDIFHMMREDEPAENIRKAEGYIEHTHIAELERRTAPGTEGDDFTPYLKALLDIGYDGAMSIEGRWDDFDAHLPVAMATLREQIEQVKGME